MAMSNVVRPLRRTVGQALRAVGIDPARFRRAANRADGLSDEQSDQVEQINLIAAGGGYAEASAASRALLDANPTPPPALARRCLNQIARCELALGNHDAVMRVADEMTDVHNFRMGQIHKARSYFVRGLDAQALAVCQTCHYTNPTEADVYFLTCEVADRMDNAELAWSSLEEVAKFSASTRIWTLGAGLVRDEQDLFRLLAMWKAWKKSRHSARHHISAYGSLTLAAARTANYQLARAIWRQSLLGTASGRRGFEAYQPKKPTYTANLAEQALLDINRILRDTGIDMFLVSGTLLGCVREDRLLSHDKDIDVGIWSDVDPDRVAAAVSASGLIEFRKSRSKEIILLKHVNGVVIDVFYHFRDPDDYWHAGVKIKWHNAAFNLVPRTFLGDSFLIPENYDLYLTENYGDWRTPQIAFDSAYDTPNGEVINNEEMVIHAFRTLRDMCMAGKWTVVPYYLDKLTEYGEGAFVEKFREKLNDKITAALDDTAGGGHADESDETSDADEATGGD